MLDTLKNKIIQLLNRLHFYLFKSEMGEGAKDFVRNMSYTTFGNIGYTFFLFLVNTAVIRLLGPEEYGKYILVFSATGLMTAPMFLGQSVSITKYLPETPGDEKGRRAIIATSFWATLCSSALLGLFFFLSRKPLAALFGESTILFGYSIALSIFIVLQTTASSTLQGLKQFKKLAVIQTIYAMVICAVFFGLYFFYPTRNYEIYVWAIIAGLAVNFLIIFINNRRSYSISFFEINLLKKLLRYGSFVIFNSLCLFVVIDADRFLSNRYMDVKTVGIFAAYYGSSMIITSRSIGLFLNVFFPTVAGLEYKYLIAKKLNILFKFIFIPFLIVNLVLMYVMFLVYGKNYPVNYLWFILFSLAAVLYAFAQTKWHLIFSKDVESLQRYGYYLSAGAIGSLFLNFILIKYFGIIGAVSVSIAVHLFLLISADRYLRLHFYPKAPNETINN